VESIEFEIRSNKGDGKKKKPSVMICSIVSETDDILTQANQSPPYLPQRLDMNYFNWLSLSLARKDASEPLIDCCV
jgi:hypothetical protein